MSSASLAKNGVIFFTVKPQSSGYAARSRRTLGPADLEYLAGQAVIASPSGQDVGTDAF